MPISTRGLGMATNATQNLAQFMAALGAQKAQGIRGLGDTARQIQQDAARRQMAQAAQDQRQQQIDMQQAQMLTDNYAASRKERQQEAQRAALEEHLKAKDPSVTSGMGSADMRALLGNLHASSMQKGQQDFLAGEGGKDRDLRTFLAKLAEQGQLERQNLRFGHERGMQTERIGHAASEGQKDRDSSLHRVKLNIFNQSAENERGRRARAAENAKDRASSEKIAGMRGASGPSDMSDIDKHGLDAVKRSRAELQRLRRELNKPGKAPSGRDAAPDMTARAAFKSQVEAHEKQHTNLLKTVFQRLRKEGKPIPDDIRSELAKVLGIGEE